MDIKLSERVQRIQPSPTLALTGLVAKLKAEGRNIIALGAGEPDFDTPEHIKDAAIKALRDGHTKYTPVEGIASLKQAVVDKFKRENELNYKTEQVLVSCGGKQSIFNLVSAYINPGDEVIIPSPYWVSYPDIVTLHEGVPVFIEGSQDQRFKITPAQLAAAITPKTRLFFINSPSNPAGTAYTHAELRALGDVLRKHPHVLIATDDMYEHIMWTDEAFANILMVCPDLYDRTMVLNGVSKAYSMTGWRIGYAAGPQNLIKAMSKVQSQSTTHAASIAQYAAVAALNGDQNCIKEMVVAFKRRHDLLHKGLNEISGIECIAGDGTFYLFPQVKGLIQKLGLKNDMELASFLIEKAEVALVPGSSFGMDGYTRLSFATSDANLVEALARIKKVIA
ncbi:MAG: pyridoxal phosphate-dependent aminotransferase [Gammaproteobacteria bacterium]|nr:pyridoxal phosphate-dependent aminotransferase [Gammaproteobacteria bacterium]